MLGFYIVPGLPEVHEGWERVAGALLFVSCFMLVIGLLWSGGNGFKREWDLIFVRRWGYLAYAISMTLFGLGSMTLDDGWISGTIMIMFAGCAMLDWRYENTFVKGMIRRVE